MSAAVAPGRKRTAVPDAPGGALPPSPRQAGARSAGALPPSPQPAWSGGPRADAVFSGGGVKVIGLAGAAAAVEAAGYHWVNLAGNSGGAIVAALLAAGYTAAQVGGWLTELDLRRLGGTGWAPAEVWSLIRHDGLHSAQPLEAWLAERLAARGVRRFGDLVNGEFADQPRYRWRLQVTASDVSRGRLLVLPGAVEAYGVRPDDLDVARAVRWSASMPFYYVPGHLGDSVIVDGGLYSNFPIWLFDTSGAAPWPTFGFQLGSSGDAPRRPHRIRGPLSLAHALADDWLRAGEAVYQAEPHTARTITVPDLGVGTVQFDLPPIKRTALYDAGYEAAKRFLHDWDFAAYCRRHRAP